MKIGICARMKIWMDKQKQTQGYNLIDYNEQEHSALLFFKWNWHFKLSDIPLDGIIFVFLLLIPYMLRLITLDSILSSQLKKNQSTCVTCIASYFNILLFKIKKKMSRISSFLSFSSRNGTNECDTELNVLNYMGSLKPTKMLQHNS